jgi:hypothetical protein
MLPASQPSLWRSKLFLLALFLLSLAAITYVALSVTTTHEQALTPGEKNYGVAVLAMLFGMPLLFFVASGLVALLLSGIVFLCRKFARQNQLPPSPQPGSE